MSTPVAEETQVASPPPPRSLWRHADFLKLWSGQSLSMFGSQVTLVALPLLAVAILDASTTQMGLLAALGRLPFLLMLFIGVWVDRMRRRPIMIGTDLGRAVLLGLIPVLYFAGDLKMLWLYVVMFGVGILTVLFDVAYAAYLPSLVQKEDLPEANSKLQISASVAEVSGPGVVGVLLRWISAAALLIVDAISFLVSAIMVMFIRHPEKKVAAPEKANGEKGPNIFVLIWEGVRWVWHQPLLRPNFLSMAAYFFFVTGIQALYVLYAYRELGLSASVIGFILAVGGPAAIFGSWIGPRLLKRYGLGKMLILAALGGNTSFILIPLATGPNWLEITMLVGAQVAFGLTMPLGIIASTTIRQALTPDHMQGRVVATNRSVGLGLAPFGALLAGLLANEIGTRPTILIGAIGAMIPIALVFFSPLPKLKDVSDVVAAAPK